MRERLSIRANRLGARGVSSLGRRPVARAARLSVGLSLLVLLAACGDDEPPEQPDTCTGPFCDLDLGGDGGPDAGPDGDADVGCETDEACGPSEYCNTATGECLTGCRIDSQSDTDNCSDECQACSPDTHTCVVIPGCGGCEADTECAETQYCDVDSGRCITGCRYLPDDPERADNCDPGQYCDEFHRCLTQPCVLDADCPGGQYCYELGDETLGNRCRDGCRTDDPETAFNEDNCRRFDPTAYCDPDTHVCLEVVCSADDACPDRYVCEGTACRPGCRSDVDCSDNQPCDEISRTCRCLADEDCGEGRLCVGQLCVERCDANSDCRGGANYCNLETGRCFAECTQEAGEPNNTPTDAAPVDLTETGVLVGVLCGVDVDVFRFAGIAGETLRLTVSFDPGTIEMAILDRTGTGAPLVEGSADWEDDDGRLVLEYAMETDQFHFLRIGGSPVTDQTTGAASLGYAIGLQRYPTDLCVDDDAEDDDGFATASELEEAGVSGRWICAEDTSGDYFHLALPANRRADITLDFDLAQGDLDLALYDSARRPVTLVDSGDATEVLTVGPEAVATEWFVQVLGHSATDEASYQLSLLTSEIFACVPDELEPDDGAPEGATPVGAGPGASVTLEDLTACDGDSDWFIVDGLAGGAVRAQLTQGAGTRTVELALYGPALGTTLDEVADASTSKEVLAEELDVSGHYYVSVTDQGGDPDTLGVSYDLKFDVFPPTCEDDFELDGGDDTLANATPISESGTVDFDSDDVLAPNTLRACRGDDDYFHLELNGSGELTVLLTAAQNRENLRMDLLDDLGEVVLPAPVRTTTTIGFLDQPVPAGVYYLRVYPVDDTSLPLVGQSYRLQAAFAPDVVCVDPGFEPNDDVSHAVVLGDGDTIGGQHLCPGDADFYRVPLAVPVDLRFVYTFYGGNPAAEIELWAFTLGQPLESQYSETAEEDGTGNIFISYDDPEADAIIEVRATSGMGPAGLGYSGQVTLTPTPPPSCESGRNDNPGSADRVLAGSSATGLICEGAKAYYLVVLEPFATHTLTLVDDSGADGALVMELTELDDPLSPSQPEVSTTGGTAVITRGDFDGRYLVEVRQASSPAPDEGIPFTLSLVTEVDPVCGDAFEPNDTPDFAVLVGGNIALDFQICAPDDEDWIHLEVSGQDTRDVTLTVTQASVEEPLLVEIFEQDGDGSPAGAPVYSDDPVDSGVPFTLEALPVGAYLVHVTYGSSAAQLADIPYQLDIAFDLLACSDGLEPNDLVADATPLPPPVDGLGESTFENVKVCPGDVDLYAFDVATDATIDVTVERAVPTTALTLLLVTDPGNLSTAVATAEGGTDATRFGLTSSSLTAGRYYLHLAPTGEAEPPAGGERYDLTAVVTEAVGCDDDDLEENDNLDQATTMADPGEVSARLCSVDDDVYAIVVPLGPVEVEAALATARPELLDLLTVDLVSREDVSETILASGLAPSAGGLPAGTYYLRVRLADGVDSSNVPPGGVAYQLAAGSVPDGCPVDSAEENDAIDPPDTPLAPGLDTTLYLCADDDFFFVEVTDPAQSINITVQHDGSNFPLDVAVLEEDGTSVASFSSDLAFTSVWVPTPGTGDYYIQLHHAVGGGTRPLLGLPYQIAVTVSTSTSCLGDGLEPNDSADDATPVQPGVTGAILCPGDDDWYELEVVSSLADLFVQLDKPGASTFTFELLDVDGAPLTGCSDPSCSIDGLQTCGIETVDTQSTSVTETQWVWFASDLSPGRYRVHVASDGAPLEGLDYQLTATVLERGCFPDHLEPNETFDTAPDPERADGTALPADGSRTSLRLCQGDVDTVRLQVDELSLLQVLVARPLGDVGGELVTDPACGESATIEDPASLDLALLDGAGDPIPEMSDVRVGEPFYVEGVGPFYARINDAEDAVPTVGQPYRFGWLLTPPCADDAYEAEGGDSLDDPIVESSLPEPPDPASLALCGADEDVIEFTTGATAEDLEIHVRFEDITTEAVVELYSNSLVLLDSNDQIDQPPVVVRQVDYPAGTTYLVRVAKTAPAPPDRRGYTLLNRSAAVCDDDGSEENDTADDATAASLDTPRDATACAQDIDYWRIPVTDGLYKVTVTGPTSTLAVATFFDASPSGGDLVTLGPGWETQRGATSFVAMGPIEADGDLIVSVESQSNADYNLRVEPMACYDDPVDGTDGVGDNETYETAAPFDETVDLYAICPAADQDWLAFQVAPVYLCTNTCETPGNGSCDDGGEGSDTSDCLLGTDCGDCGARFVAAPVYYCADTCDTPSNGSCDDGGEGSDTSDCLLGTDCGDCGSRLVADAGKCVRLRIDLPSFFPGAIPGFDLALVDADGSTALAAVDESTGLVGGVIYTDFVFLESGNPEVGGLTTYYAHVSSKEVPFQYSLSIEQWSSCPP